MENKVCKKCGIEKPLTEYRKHIRMKFGITNVCKRCLSVEKKNWIKNNLDKVREGKRRYKQKKRDIRLGIFVEGKVEKIKVEKPIIKKEPTVKVVNRLCRTCGVNLTKENTYAGCGNNCRTCEKERIKKYRETYPERRKQTKDKWKKENPEHHKMLKKNHKKRKKQKDPVYRSMLHMRGRTSAYCKRNFNSKRSRFREIIGIDPQGFRSYIESKFKEGMSWDNYGLYTWHIDHIIPLSSAKTIQEVEQLSHYTNLQPLWMKENIEKSDKIL